MEELDGVLLGLVAALCWGSWLVPMKFARNSQRWASASFLVFIYFYAAGVFLMVAFLAMVGEYRAHGVIAGLVFIPFQRLVAALLAGAVWQVGNLLVALTVQNAGPGFAMCCCGSLAMTFGTGLTYWIEPVGNTVLLSAGVMLAVAAAATTFQMHKVKDRALKKHVKKLTREAAELHGDAVNSCGSPDLGSPPASPSSTATPQRKAGRRLTFILGGASGIGIALFGPLNTLALVPMDFMGEIISVDACMFWFGIGVFLAAHASLPMFRMLVPQQFEDQTPGQVPLIEATSLSFVRKALQEAYEASAISICLSTVAGAIWGAGLWANLRCSVSAGFALAYGLGQTAPLASIFWGVFLYREFSGDWIPKNAKVWLAADVLLYFGAVACFVVSKLSY